MGALRASDIEGVRILEGGRWIALDPARHSVWVVHRGVWIRIWPDVPATALHWSDRIDGAGATTTVPDTPLDAAFSLGTRDRLATAVLPTVLASAPRWSDRLDGTPSRVPPPTPPPGLARGAILESWTRRAAAAGTPREWRESIAGRGGPFGLRLPGWPGAVGERWIRSGQVADGRRWSDRIEGAGASAPHAATLGAAAGRMVEAWRVPGGGGATPLNVRIGDEAALAFAATVEAVAPGTVLHAAFAIGAADAAGAELRDPVDAAASDALALAFAGSVEAVAPGETPLHAAFALGAADAAGAELRDPVDAAASDALALAFAGSVRPEAPAIPDTPLDAPFAVGARDDLSSARRLPARLELEDAAALAFAGSVEATPPDAVVNAAFAIGAADAAAAEKRDAVEVPVSDAAALAFAGSVEATPPDAVVNAAFAIGAADATAAKATGRIAAGVAESAALAFAGTVSPQAPDTPLNAAFALGADDALDVDVEDNAPPAVAPWGLVLSSTNDIYGGFTASILTWHANGTRPLRFYLGTSETVRGDEVQEGGSFRAEPTETTTYWLWVENSAGTAKTNVTVYVTDHPPPQLTSISGSPAEIPSSRKAPVTETFTLTWAFTGDGVSVAVTTYGHAWSNLPASGSLVLQVTAGSSSVFAIMTFTATATDSVGRTVSGSATARFGIPWTIEG